MANEYEESSDEPVDGPKNDTEAVPPPDPQAEEPVFEELVIPDPQDAGVPDFNRAESVDTVFRSMSEVDAEETRALRAEWGKEAGTNLRFAQSLVFANPEFTKRFARAGFLNDPVVIGAAATLGRLLAKTSGDPRTVASLFDLGVDTTGESGEKAVDDQANATLEEQLEELQEEKMMALKRGDSIKATKLDARQAALYEKLYGDDPVVGSRMRKV